MKSHVKKIFFVTVIHDPGSITCEFRTCSDTKTKIIKEIMPTFFAHKVFQSARDNTCFVVYIWRKVPGWSQM